MRQRANLAAPGAFQYQYLAEGRLTRLVGMTLEAEGLQASLGQTCQIINKSGHSVEAEVVGFNGSKVYLMPITHFSGVEPGARVKPQNESAAIPIGEQLLGRVLNGIGQPIDGLGPVKAKDSLRLIPEMINPLARAPIANPMDVGIRAINALLTVGQGQRLGLFAGSGVGKSVLLGMMTRFTKADIVVVGLIGERGREVKEFIDHSLGAEGLARAVVVASPADDAPLMRLRASELCCRIAEYYRDQGKNVLLLMDSLTRYAQAQREVSLAIGEPPATKGYPPSVFAKLPQLVERAGNGPEGSGSITAFYTVLTEGDDLQDPVADSARAILDGHIVLSRRLAEEGVYPAIDVEASISRAMPNIVAPEQLQQMQAFKRLLATYQQNKDLISIGAYRQGSNPEVDLAIERFPMLRQFVCQGMAEAIDFSTAQLHLGALLQGNNGAAS
ncbi:MAG: flagellar protein export ATPase FliI [Cellvibrionaceae bacterium]|nr:flagellar protein export ATPase FliI [Cellvibrionaceae bacterium]